MFGLYQTGSKDLSCSKRECFYKTSAHVAARTELWRTSIRDCQTSELETASV